MDDSSKDIVTRGGEVMNRHQRRTALATGKPIHKPNYTMRVLLIDGPRKRIVGTILRAGPEQFADLLGNRPLSWAEIGHIDERVRIMLAGDQRPQEHDIGHRWYEQEFEVLNSVGEASPVLRGKAAVFGYMPALHKGGSTPVGINWLEPRVRWLDPLQAAIARKAYGETPGIEAQARLEDQSGQVGEPEEA